MRKPRFVDFHCHLDLYKDHANAVAECEKQEIFTLAVTTTPRAWPRNNQLTSTTKFVRTALGLHPQLVKDRASEIDLWRSYLPNARYVGEVGLDAGPRFYSSFDTQKQVFETILRECASLGGKVLTIHSVRATKIVLDMLEEYLPRSRGSAVMHWFTGSKSDAQRAVGLGTYFSINREMLHNDRHRATVLTLPIERLLTETDGPFVKLHDRDVRPADVSTTVEELARLRSIPAIELADIIASNLKRLVSE